MGAPPIREPFFEGEIELQGKVGLPQRIVMQFKRTTRAWAEWVTYVYRVIAALLLSGPTAGRPTDNLWVGQPFFDTDLDQPVFWNGTTWVTAGGAVATPAHNDLTGLQGGAATEYYHLTAAQYAALGGGGITFGTPVVASGTTTTIATGLPAGIKRVDIPFTGISTGGTTGLMLQIGPAAGLEVAGYTGGCTRMAGAAVASTLTGGTGFLLIEAIVAAGTYSGVISLVLENSTTNTWSITGTLSRDATTVMNAAFAGSKTLAGPLSEIAMTTVGGDTFDAGEINYQRQS